MMQHSCTPFDPLVDTESVMECQSLRRLPLVAPPSIRLWILKEEPTHSQHEIPNVVAPPSIRLWILKDRDVDGWRPNHIRVAPPSIRLWILKVRQIPERLSVLAPLHPLRSACGY